VRTLFVLRSRGPSVSRARAQDDRWVLHDAREARRGVI
jgi:hypothetical protein